MDGGRGQGVSRWRVAERVQGSSKERARWSCTSGKGYVVFHKVSGLPVVQRFKTRRAYFDKIRSCHPPEGVLLVVSYSSTSDRF